MILYFIFVKWIIYWWKW